jgi:putative DNA primase/helicase
MGTQKETPGGEPGADTTQKKCNLVIHQKGEKVKGLAAVPAELKALSRWVAWRSEDRDGRPTKVPYHAAYRKRADTTDASTWSSFTDTLHHVNSDGRFFAGLGFVLGDGFAGVDLDDCLDDHGELHPAAAEVVAALDSYTEVSPSGRGLKVFVRADLGDRDGHRTKAVPWGGEVEVYWRDRYFTTTGNHWPGTPKTVEDRQAALTDLHTRFLARADTPSPVSTPAPIPPTADVADLLQVAFRAANGAKIRTLFDEVGHDGGSEGDAALCGHLAFYSGGDPGLLERMMMASSRRRPKWFTRRGTSTWIAEECRKAVERHTGDYYTPGRPAVTAASTDKGTTTATTPADKILTFNRTDAGNGEALAFLYGDRLRFDWKRQRWLCWGDHTWRPATDGDLTTLAKRAARERYVAAGAADDLESRKWAFGSESKGRVEAALYFARAEPPITDPGDGWDGNPMLLGCPNGIVELETGTFRPGRPEDRVTLQVGVPYDPQAECPRWLQFLEEVFGGDADLINFVWRAVGYSLTGSTKSQCFFLLHGKGSNGKSVLLSVLRHVLGDYAHNTSFSLFDYAARHDHSQNLAQLELRHFVTASESAENCRLNEDRLKALAGSDPISARLMRENDRTFDNTAKVWLGVNHKPRVLDDSDGFWRKARLIPFTRRFVDPEKLAADPSLSLDPNILPADRDLETALKAEAPGILRWAVQGAALWACDGLREPETVRAASQAWREEADPLGDFFATRCVVTDNAKVRAGDLYAAYCEWCEEEGLKDRERMTQQAFGRRIAARFDKKQRAYVNGKTGPAYYGIGLRAEGSD